jgi:hypothetical protein
MQDEEPGTDSIEEHLLVELERERQRSAALARDLQAERKFSHIACGASAARIMWLDPRLNIRRVTAAYARDVGHSPETLAGRRYFALFPHAETQALFERVARIGKPATYQGNRRAHIAATPSTDEPIETWLVRPFWGETGPADGPVELLVEATGATDDDGEEQVLTLLDRSRALQDDPRFEVTARAVFDLCEQLTGATAGYVALLLTPQ